MSYFLNYLNEVQEFHANLNHICIRSNLFWSNLLLGIPLRRALHPIAELNGFLIHENIAWLLIDPHVPLHVIQCKFLDLFKKVDIFSKQFPLKETSQKSKEIQHISGDSFLKLNLFKENVYFSNQPDDFFLQLTQLDRFVQDNTSKNMRICINFHIELNIPIEEQQIERYDTLYSDPEQLTLIELFDEGLRLNILGPDCLEPLKGMIFALFPDLFTEITQK